MGTRTTRLDPRIAEVAVLRAIYDKEACPALTDWSSVADIAHHAEHDDCAPRREMTRHEITAACGRLIDLGLVRRTRIMKEARFRLTDLGLSEVRRVSDVPA